METAQLIVDFLVRFAPTLAEAVPGYGRLPNGTRALLLNYSSLRPIYRLSQRQEDLLSAVRRLGLVDQVIVQKIGQPELTWDISREAETGAETMKSITDIQGNPFVQAGELKLTLPLLRVVTDWLQSPETRGGLVRLTDERQVLMTGASGVLVTTDTLVEAVQRRREEFWYLPDLEEMRRRSRQEAGFEFTFRTFDPVLGGDWMSFTNRYRVVEDGLGNTYHVGENLAWESIPDPVPTR